jgi:hypothetical protein
MAPHPQRLTVSRRAWPLARPRTTLHEVETTADVVVAEISDVESRGRGEGVPLQRYGENADSVVAALDAMKGAIASGLDRDALQSALPPGAARNALDCAFWDMDAKRAYRSVAELAGLGALKPVVTAFTLDFDAPDKMARRRCSSHSRHISSISTDHCTWRSIAVRGCATTAARSIRPIRISGAALPDTRGEVRPRPTTQLIEARFLRRGHRAA